MSVTSINPCITCGACCAYFRVSFYWTEADAMAGGSVPPEFTLPLTPHLVAMQGTHSKQPRCVCLIGTIGDQVQCNIYPLRSSTCREFAFAWQDGIASEHCDRARKAWGLPPLDAPTPWIPEHPDTPQAA